MGKFEHAKALAADGLTEDEVAARLRAWRNEATDTDLVMMLACVSFTGDVLRFQPTSQADIIYYAALRSVVVQDDAGEWVVHPALGAMLAGLDDARRALMPHCGTA